MARSKILPALALIALAGCATGPATATYKGQSVPAVSAMTMTCASPYVITQNCSPQGGANLKIWVNRIPLRVGGSADGRTIIVMTEAAIPTQARSEEAVDAVGAVAEPLGAQIVKMEALAIIGGSVLGYVLHFDRDVFTTLRRYAQPA